MSDVVDHYRAEFERVRGLLPGDAALSEVRAQALERFTERGFPGARDERWKYTRLDALARRRFQIAEQASAPAWLAELPMPGDVTSLTFVNGHLLAGESSGEIAPGVRALPLREVSAGKRASALGERMASTDTGVLPSFTALNTAFFGDGVLIELDPGARLERPLVVRFVNDATDELAQHPRIVVCAGEGASATLVEMHAGRGDAASFCNAVSQFELAPGAHVDHVKLHLESAKTHHIGATRAVLGAGARFRNVALALDGLLTRNDIEILLDGEDACVSLHGLMLGDGRRHIDYHTLVEHRSPNARSLEVYKSVLDDRSRAVFDGAVKVHVGADGTDAEQRSNNLLMSDDAEIDTKPQLEIYADDVKCAHGATVGQLDEQALFYLCARGIALGEARAMLTVGFAQEIVDAIEQPEVQALAGQLVAERLGHAGFEVGDTPSR